MSSPEAGAPTSESVAIATRGRVAWLRFVAGIFVLFAVAIMVQARTRWFPQSDLAMTELHVRDVGTLHPPLLGLVGRIGTVTEKGTHLGPVSFFALWPFYELFGASSWALLAAAASLNVIAAAVALWLALRRSGLRLMLGIGAVVVALMAYLGPSVMTQPWNPYLPILWWLVFLLAVWSVTCGDIAVLPVAAFAGSLCVQTHISYTVLVAACLVLVLAHVVLQLIRGGRPERGRILRWSAVAAAISVVVWLPPVYQQFNASDGNLSIAFRYFTNPPQAPIGLHRGLVLMLVHLNPWTIVSSRSILITSGSTVPGALLALAWAASVVAAWRLREHALLRLHVLIAVTLAAGIWSMSRIFGFEWYYVMLWAWCLCALVVVAVLWTAGAALHRSEAHSAAGILRACATPLILVVCLGLALMFLHDALNVEVPPSVAANTVVRKLVEPTITAIRRGKTPGGGRGGVYLVTYSDPVLFGSHAFALVDELERAGLRVGMPPGSERYVDPKRTFDQDRATAIVHLAVGADIQHWEQAKGVVEVVKVDPRTPQQRVVYDELLARVRSQLAAAGLNRIIPMLDENLFGAMDDSALPSALRPLVASMIGIGLPEAVFVAPVYHVNPSPAVGGS